MIRLLGTTLVCTCLLGCASTTARGKESLNPGMSTAQVKKLLGSADGRSFNNTNEAWQYQDVVGFGQCEYLTAWFTDGGAQGRDHPTRR
jgi:hypothetical protein